MFPLSCCLRQPAIHLPLTQWSPSLPDVFCSLTKRKLRGFVVLADVVGEEKISRERSYRCLTIGSRVASIFLFLADGLCLVVWGSTYRGEGKDCVTYSTLRGDEQRGLREFQAARISCCSLLLWAKPTPRKVRSASVISLTTFQASNPSARKRSVYNI